jgi:hypothetical protein
MEGEYRDVGGGGEHGDAGGNMGMGVGNMGKVNMGMRVGNMCHVLSRTGRASQASHTDYHWDRPRSYCHNSLMLVVSLLSCDVPCDV